MTTTQTGSTQPNTKDKTELWFNNPHHAYSVTHTPSRLSSRKGVTDTKQGDKESKARDNSPKTQAWFTTGPREKGSKLMASTHVRRVTTEVKGTSAVPAVVLMILFLVKQERVETDDQPVSPLGTTTYVG